jgi:hypothetical protein
MVELQRRHTHSTLSFHWPKVLLEAKGLLLVHQAKSSEVTSEEIINSFRVF